LAASPQIPAKKTAVLLLAHGTPGKVEEVPEFLRNVTGGRPIPPKVVAEVQHRYSLIGRSPLHDYSFHQAEMLERELEMPVYVGMRNWGPLIPDVLRKMAGDAIERAIVICLAPHNSRTSVGLYRKALEGEDGAQAPFDIDFVESWHDHPLLVRAFAEKLRVGWGSACEQLGARAPVIFTAHSVPLRTITGGDPYEQQARETAALVAMEVPSLSVDDWMFAFQSQGMSGGPWLGPTVEDTMRALADAGRRGVFLQPIGFLCDHVEVLYDIDIAFKSFAEAQGMQLWRAQSLNDSPVLTAALADIARSRLPNAASSPVNPLVQIKS
jgi:protoporphyrin/coproporphyrin ferrochelatase